MEEIKRLKNILLLSIFLAIFLAAGTRLYIELKEHDLQSHKTVEKQLSTVGLIFNNTLKNIDQFYSAQITSILSDAKTLNAIKNKNRNYLLAHLLPMYKNLQKANPNLIIFHIHDKDNRSLIRYHKLDTYGDKPYSFRKMLQNAHKTLQTQHGVEAGLHDKNHLTYRIVTPIIDDGKYIGIIEFGVALDKMVPHLTETINKALGVPKHFRLAFKIKNDEVNFKDPSLFVRLGEYSIPTYFSEVIDILKQYSAKNSTSGKIIYHSQKLKIFQNSIYIKNFLSKNIASVIIVMNVSNFADQRMLLIKEGLMKPFFVLSVLFTLVLLFFNKILKRFGKIKNTIESNYTRLKTILDAQADIIVITDGTNLLQANKAFLNFFHYEFLEDFLKNYNCICDHFEKEENKNYLQAQMGELRWSEYINKHPEITHKVKIQEHIFTVHQEAYLSENTTEEYIIVFHDITVLELHQDQLHHLAYIDNLTQLPNRADFLNIVKNTLINEKGLENNTHALMFLDLDGFKQVNDIHGHDIGDDLLKEVSLSITELLKDRYYLARLGGDEFVVLMNSFESKESIVTVATNILHIFKKEFLCKNKKLSVGASIGISLYPQDAENVSQLLKSADIAMYHAKKNGKNRFEFYHKSMQDEMYRYKEIEDDLKVALQNDELYLVYQPQVDIQENKLVGVEALIRWKHPTKGEIYPNQFIPIAEKTDLIIKIGEFVLRRAILELGELIKEHKFRLSINATNRELKEDNFVDKIISACKQREFDLNYLEIEFIERDALDDMETIRQIISKLHQKGVIFALDDFGTGYSSLSYINRLNIDVLKIDKSFIENIFVEENRLAIVKSIISIAKNINLDVVAEGVERKEEYDVLQVLQCDIIQGYYFAKPMKIDALLNYTTNTRKL